MYSVKEGTLKFMVRELVQKALQRNKFNVAKTAEELGMVRQSIYRYLK